MKTMKDPVCGLQLEHPGALRIWYHGTEYAFCGPTCRTRFITDPDRFIAGAEPTYTKFAGVVAPRGFGSAGSGGAEYEPGPKP